MLAASQTRVNRCILLLAVNDGDGCAATRTTGARVAPDPKIDCAALCCRLARTRPLEIATMLKIRIIAPVLLAAIVPAASLLAWALAHQSGGVAALALLPLAAVVSVAHYLLYSRLYRARMDAELQPDSVLRRVPAGQCKALTRTALLVPASIAVLAFETVYSGFRELVLAFLLCGLSGAVFLYLRSLMPIHFRTPYDDVKSAGLGALVAALPFVGVVCLLVHAGEMPGDARHEALGDWILAYAKERIPAPEGLKATLLGTVFDIEAAGESARRQLVDYLGEAEWVRVFYCVYGAIVCLVVARMGVFCAMFVQCAMALLGIGNPPEKPGSRRPTAKAKAKPGLWKDLRNRVSGFLAFRKR